MDTIKKTDTHVFNTYARIPTVFVRGEGATLWDDQGRAYTDFLAGIAVVSLGHCHPDVTRAIADQAATLVHVSNLFYTEPQAELARQLVEKSFADKVFFANSGAEANEAAIKLARRYFKEKGEPERFRIITMTQSFHGRTMATLSATGQDKIKEGFSPLVDGFVHCPFNDIDALAALVDDTVCAVMMECIQGEGGIVPAGRDYIRAVRELCNERGILLIFDEVQTGMGRCGSLFAHELFGVTPDILTLAKALGNGLPIGAMLASTEAATGFTFGSHATTFGGTPLVTRAALEVLKIVSDPGFLSETRAKGAYLKQGLTALMARHRTIRAVRGEGLLVGMELDGNAGEVVAEAMKKGFILNAIQGKVIRFAPPLVVTREEIDAVVNALDDLLE